MVRGRYLSDHSVNMPQISRGSSLDTPLSKSYHGYPMLLPQMLPDCVKHHQATQIWDLLDFKIKPSCLVSPEPVRRSLWYLQRMWTQQDMSTMSFHHYKSSESSQLWVDCYWVTAFLGCVLLESEILLIVWCLSWASDNLRGSYPTSGWNFQKVCKTEYSDASLNSGSS